jgi:hypothetical protein
MHRGIAEKKELPGEKQPLFLADLIVAQQPLTFDLFFSFFDLYIQQPDTELA